MVRGLREALACRLHRSPPHDAEVNFKVDFHEFSVRTSLRFPHHRPRPLFVLVITTARGMGGSGDFEARYDGLALDSAEALGWGFEHRMRLLRWALRSEGSDLVGGLQEAPASQLHLFHLPPFHQRALSPQDYGFSTTMRSQLQSRLPRVLRPHSASPSASRSPGAPLFSSFLESLLGPLGTV
ncbi:hypothetical protein CCMA1212_010361 [Trichoderma ghanense]|uniref:Uncharacterized protein n=1 Tax=Trichoderma ghanense TaxID=65468 RepID=A0ABY2GR69_9HYPO